MSALRAASFVVRSVMSDVLDWFRYYVWQIVLLVMVVVFVTIIGFVSWAIIFAPESSAAAIEREWIEEFWQQESDPAWQAEQARLHRKHGTGHVIVYTPQGAYYVNARGEKCRFM